MASRSEGDERGNTPDPTEARSVGVDLERLRRLWDETAFEEWRPLPEREQALEAWADAAYDAFPALLDRLEALTAEVEALRGERAGLQKALRLIGDLPTDAVFVDLVTPREVARAALDPQPETE